MTMRIIVGVEGNSTDDVAVLEHVDATGRAHRVELRRGETVDLPSTGTIQLVKAKHYAGDAEYMHFLASVGHPVVKRFD